MLLEPRLLLLFIAISRGPADFRSVAFVRVRSRAGSEGAERFSRTAKEDSQRH